MKHLTKNKKKLIYSIVLISIITFINTIQGFVYAQYGLCFSLFLLEVLSLTGMVLLFNTVWCYFEDRKLPKKESKSS